MAEPALVATSAGAPSSQLGTECAASADSSCANSGRRASRQAVLRAGRALGRRRNLRRVRRWGLAPIELVLWAPVLLFVMALMVNYGTAAAWRLRGEVISRDAVWRTRFPRYNGDELPPKPPTWPKNATQSQGTAPDYDLLDLAPLQQPVARGPLPSGFRVKPILDPTPGAEQGLASVRRRYPLLPRLGSFQSGDIENDLLDRPWVCDEMGIPNWFRRTLLLYELPRTDPSLPAAYAQTAQSITQIPHFQALSVLDDNADWKRYMPWHHLPMPDFHPRVNAGRCELDPQVVYRSEVQRLIDVRTRPGNWRLGLISRVPRRLTEGYLNMYIRTKRQMEVELNLMPPPPPARIAFLQAEIEYIDRQIPMLQAFEARITGFENRLRTRP